ncbi:nuclear transport factor 2 family protein [Pseudonocardia broussonetiae]|uniref:SnoaL-like domain-containing protein n=1 Tax=Pseudonocardia broussonetiae TaxID=2736640 RepID=A0A6M6JH95_9PSEU|nr:nuclear transport factor 2 family protein [Pseudonocardia broussonetiae]QJY47414.1 SnoaL-like domain-containing protein [Pseudonocardia broussonetiae]
MTAGDVETITQLVLHERRARDRGWWDRMRDAYWPEAVVSISWFTGPAHEFVTASEAMSGGGTVATHRLAPVVVETAGERALAEAPAAIEVVTTVDGAPAVLTSFTRLQFRALRREGRWRLLGLDAVYERDALEPATPGATVAVDAAALAPFRSSYRLLSWHLTGRGHTIGADLLGDDRPAEVAAFYEREHRWLHDDHLDGGHR